MFHKTIQEHMFKPSLAPVIIVPREEWGAVPPTSTEPQVLPVKTIVVYPESEQKPCTSKKQCARRLQELQNNHMIRGWPDIKYNFLIGLDGRVYEGTGWKHRAHDTHISEFKSLDNFISICFIGDFYDWIPPLLMRDALNKFIDYATDTLKYVEQAFYEDLQPHPIANVVVYPESKQKPCETKRQCTLRVQELQQEHLSDGWPDIKYNFLIGGDGKVFEGMGWKHRGHDTKISEDEKLNNFLSICYIGNFSGRKTPEVFNFRTRDLIQFGQHRRYFKPDVKRYTFNPVSGVIECDDEEEKEEESD